VSHTEALLDHLESLAQKHFGLSTLRQQQREVFNALCSHKQVLAMLPTGAGKTLIYALASLLYHEALTIVICPLIALMRDQQQRMAKAGIQSVSIYSEQSEDERKGAYKLLNSGSVKILFVSPERFALAGFQKFLKRFKIGMFVVDEAHCVVTWGHSFRPEYGQLSALLKSFDKSKILALTATASRSSRALIRDMVFPNADSVFEVVDQPLRDNIFVESIRVYSEDERWTVVRAVLSETKSSKSILYFPRREQCQRAAQELRKLGYHAIVYHAGLERDLRRSAEDYLRQSTRPVVICATLAFGMGIDLPDVQLIIVVGFPGNIEEMFQMMGRAGRQGEKARAAIVWSGSDPKKRMFQFEKMLPEQSLLVERMRTLAAFFPGDQQSKLISKAKVSELMRPFAKDERELSQCVDTLAGVLSMLGRGGSLDSSRSPWVTIETGQNKAISDLLCDLPVGLSRRRIVLEWLLARRKKESLLGNSAYLSFPLNEIEEDTQMLSERLIEVLRFYSDQGALRWKIVPTDEARNSILLMGSLPDLLQQLPRYLRWRTTLLQSLQALSTFVTAEQCRMRTADAFFIQRRQGALMSGQGGCGRCDLCRRRSVSLPRPIIDPNAGALTLNQPDHLI